MGQVWSKRLVLRALSERVHLIAPKAVDGTPYIRRMIRTQHSWRWVCLGGSAVAVVAVVACVYAVWMGYLAVFASEGNVPPRWRLPETPPGATVAWTGTQCASGGCWREVLVQPPAGQSVSSLADEMGLDGTRHLPWHPLDPHPVEVGATPSDDALLVTISY